MSSKERLAHDAHLSTENQDHPHACLDGYVSLGYTVAQGEDEDVIGVFETVPCRRCCRRCAQLQPIRAED